MSSNHLRLTLPAQLFRVSLTEGNVISRLPGIRLPGRSSVFLCRYCNLSGAPRKPQTPAIRSPLRAQARCLRRLHRRH